MRILLVDDENSARELLADYLEDQLGHQVTQCAGGGEALKLFEETYYPLVLTDIRMPGIDGIELLKRIKERPRGRTADIILITGYGDMNTAIQALRAGSYDYLLKPVNLEELDALVSKIAEHQSLLQDNYELTRCFNEKVAEAVRETESRLERIQKAYAEIVGIGRVGVFSESMREVVAMAERLHEDRSVPVLIEGETGTGKEVIARLVHYGRGEVTTSFTSINCSAISPNLFESELFGYESGAFTGARKSGQMGKLELSQGSTLFLDEIGDMPLQMQPKLLRVLQEREFYRVGGLKKIRLDVRIICATNRDLARLVKENTFRKDLFYRLNTGRISIPPLRERREDILPLARMFLEQYAGQKKRRFKSLAGDTIDILENYSWPGNVRELQNTIERAVLFHDDIELRPGHLQIPDSEQEPLFARHNERGTPESVTINFLQGGLDLKAVEREIIRKTLTLFKGNQSRAASYLGINRNTLHNRIGKPD